MLIRKYFLVVGVGFVLTFLGISSNAQEASFELIDRIAEAKSMQFLKSINFIENEIYNQFDLVYQRMEWDIDPEIKHIKGKITSFVVSKKKNLNEIYFDLHQALTVDSVVSKNEQLIFKHENNGLKIFLNRSLNISELDSLTIFYGGIPEETGFGSFVQSSHNSTPIIWTLSEPYGAMEWWPCKQSLLDKVDSIDVIVTCPEIYRTASNGILFSETVNNGKRIMFWKHRYPIATYLVAIAVTNYVEYSEYLNLTNGGKIEILNYVYPESIGYATGKTPRTIEIMELYNDLFGLYPFADEKYGHAQFGWGGGMEHQTMSFMSNFEFGLIAHELAHQWFGDYATLSSWHDIWLNEGFATFATGLAYEKLLDDLSWHEWKQKAVERITNYPAGSVYVQDITNVSQIFNGRLSYSKGGFLLRMLRWVLGDKVLFEGINNYLNDSEVANGFATQEKLIYHLESCADTSLTEFFKDWY
jgi:aminopeptidase N